MVQTIAGSTSTMDLYMAEVKQYPLLDVEQEIALAQQYARGKATARQLHDSSNPDASEQRALEAVVREGEQAHQRLIRCTLYRTDYWRRGRNLDKLGINELSVGEITRYVMEGKR